MRSLFAPALVAALAGAALAGAAPGCGGESPDGGEPQSTTGPGGTPGSGSGAGGGGASGSGSTGTGVDPDDPYTPAHAWQDCQASDQAWVRRAIFALNGRRPWGQAEVNAYEDAVKAIRKADLEAAGRYGEIAGALPPYGEDLVHARKLVAEALMREDAFRERWSDFLMDALRVVRIETKSQADCYGPPLSKPVDGGALAAYVRDSDPTASNPPIPNFNMGQLLSSAIELDDVSPVYRAHLFAMVALPFTAANVGFLELERSRRQDFGAVFNAAYIHRDLVCLTCHNSEFSVTYNEDPALNRAWPTPGLFEVALYGASNGKHDPAEEATKGTDELRAWSMLRVTGVVDENGSKPYGWSGACGTFKEPTTDDPLGIDTYFGSIRSTPEQPNRGLRASVWDLDRALRRGVDLLAAHGLTRLEGGKLADPDEAFAYLVAQNIVEKVWNEVVGSRLTIANYFPRTQIQRDTLMALTEHFVATHFSLKTLLLDILAHPVFNLKAPDEGCGVAPYELPQLLDPWSTTESDLGKRPNSPADGVFAISSRPLRRSLHRAMQWPFASEYPNGAELTFQVAIGHFIKDAEPGYRGLDFQGRLTWESVYGACSPNGAGPGDFVGKIVATAASVPGATIGDAIVALKDRLVGEPWIDPADEKAQLEALVGAPLDSTNLGALDGQLRAVCGVLVSSPQFMLGGLVPKDTRDVPKLTPPEITYAGTCGYVAQYLAQTGAPYEITCAGNSTVAKKK